MAGFKLGSNWDLYDDWRCDDEPTTKSEDSEEEDPEEDRKDGNSANSSAAP